MAVGQGIKNVYKYSVLLNLNPVKQAMFFALPQKRTGGGPFSLPPVLSVTPS